jgi:hypothetical protein
MGVKPTSAKDAAMAINDVFEQQFLAFIKPFNSELADDDPIISTSNVSGVDSATFHFSRET